MAARKATAKAKAGPRARRSVHKAEPAQAATAAAAPPPAAPPAPPSSASAHPAVIRGWAEAERLLQFSRTALWRRMRAGKFPPPRAYSRKTLEWDLAELLAWRAAQPRLEIAAPVK